MDKRRDAAAALAEYVANTETLISSALAVYAERMQDAADGARAAWQAGQADPEVRAAQDGSILTNNGLKHSGELFVESAQRARRAAEELTRLVGEWEETEAWR